MSRYIGTQSKNTNRFIEFCNSCWVDVKTLYRFNIYTQYAFFSSHSVHT